MALNNNDKSETPKRILILGRDGFISSNLQRWCLNHNVPYRAIGRSDLDLTLPKSAKKLAQIIKPNDFIVMTSVIAPGALDDIQMFVENILMAENVCRAIKCSKMGHFLYLSSEAVYSAEKIPIDEDSSREPTSLYALMHTAREMMFISAFKGMENSLCIMRLGGVFGRGDTHNQYGPNRFVRSALNHGEIILYGKGEEKRSFVSIDDLTTLIGLAFMRKSSGLMNIVPGTSITYKKIALIIKKMLPDQINLKYHPRTIPAIHKPYKKLQIFRFIYNFGRPINSVVHRVYDISKLKRAFPEFRFTPIEESIATFLNNEKIGGG